MKQDDWVRIQGLAEEFFSQGDEVVFTDGAIRILVSRLGKEVSDAFDDPSGVIARWDKNLKITRANMISFAVKRKSFTELAGARLPVITEDVARKLSEFCPDGPGMHL